MFFDSIRLINYRNYVDQNLRFHRGVNVFVGQNGQGKTNLLEGLYFLTKGQSFRPGTNPTFIRSEEDVLNSSLQAIIQVGELKSLVKIQLQSSKKELLINQKKTSTTSLKRKFPSILFSPESLSAIKEGPEQRRNLVDELILTHSPRDAKKITEFKKVLRQRNRLLKNLKHQEIDETQGYKLLSSLNQVFLKTATELSMTRVEALEVIGPYLKKAMLSISGEDLKNVDISVDYLVSSESALSFSYQEMYNALSKRLNELVSREVDSGVSLVGPHKHDVQFLFDQQDSRYYCSQGQQRALILSFKMAQIMYHYRVYQSHPILLLDDVLSELDPHKRANLVEFLKGIKSQIFITTTDIAFPYDFGDRDISIYQIQNGTAKKQEEINV